MHTASMYMHAPCKCTHTTHTHTVHTAQQYTAPHTHSTETCTVVRDWHSYTTAWIRQKEVHSSTLWVCHFWDEFKQTCVCSAFIHYKQLANRSVHNSRHSLKLKLLLSLFQDSCVMTFEMVRPRQHEGQDDNQQQTFHLQLLILSDSSGVGTCVMLGSALFHKKLLCLQYKCYVDCQQLLTMISSWYLNEVTDRCLELKDAGKRNSGIRYQAILFQLGKLFCPCKGLPF